MIVNSSILESYDRLTVGVSGGADSIALLHWLSHRYARIQAVHVNHKINAASDGWEDFCRDFCRRIDVPFFSHTVNIADAGVNNLENAARIERYKVFRMYDSPIVLGHHLNDQVETYFLRIFRGSGIDGMACMREITNVNGLTILRPLLGATKDEILSYCSKHSIEYINDPSNMDPSYDRNYLRLVIIPAIQARWSRLDRTLQGSVQLHQSNQELLDDLAREDFFLLFCVSTCTIDIRSFEKMKDNRLGNMFRWLARHYGGHTFRHNSITDVIRICRQCGPNSKTSFTWGRIHIKQKGYKWYFDGMELTENGIYHNINE